MHVQICPITICATVSCTDENWNMAYNFPQEGLYNFNWCNHEVFFCFINNSKWFWIVFLLFVQKFYGIEKQNFSNYFIFIFPLFWMMTWNTDSICQVIVWRDKILWGKYLLSELFLCNSCSKKYWFTFKWMRKFHHFFFTCAKHSFSYFTSQINFCIAFIFVVFFNISQLSCLNYRGTIVHQNLVPPELGVKYLTALASSMLHSYWPQD